jgi:hypothetical protein
MPAEPGDELAGRSAHRLRKNLPDLSFRKSWRKMVGEGAPAVFQAALNRSTALLSSAVTAT